MSFPRVEGYVVVEKLGSGSYSTVYKAYAKVGPRAVVAIKCVDKSRLKHSEGAVDNLITEIRLLKTLRHPHVVHMKEFSWDDKHIFIVMEYCCGDLSKYIKRYGRLPERQVLFFLQQLASALKFLRDKGVAHMDLKPHNLLLSKSSEGKYTLKVADFGFAQYMSADSIESSIRGSPLYMAPEMLTADTPTYDASVDLWSVGVIMYECLFGAAPYSSSSFKELMEKIVSRQPIEMPSQVQVSAGCADLLTRLLQHDPALRVTHEEFFHHRYLDLAHMPSQQNYEKAVGLIKRAVEMDSKRQLAEAFDLYCESLRYLVPVVNAETDSVRRSALRAKVTRYMQRAEELKRLVSACAGAAPPPPSSVAEPPPRACAPGLMRCCTAAPGSDSGGESATNNDPTRNANLCNCTRVQLSKSDSVRFTSGCSCAHAQRPTGGAPHRQPAESSARKQREVATRQNSTGRDEHNLESNRIEVSGTRCQQSNVLGGPQSNVLGGPQSNVLGEPQRNVFGGQESDVFGGQQSNVFGRPQSNVLGEPQSNVFGGPKSNVLGEPQRNVFGGPKSNVLDEPQRYVFGGPQRNVYCGPESNVFGRPQSNVLDELQSNVLGGPQSNVFMGPQNIEGTGVDETIPPLVGSEEIEYASNSQSVEFDRNLEPEGAANDLPSLERNNTSIIEAHGAAAEKPKKVIFGETQDVCRVQ